MATYGPEEETKQCKVILHTFNAFLLTGAQIFISGDSAGGNMALSLMSHLVHPHPEVSNKISLSEPIAGAILISPWIKFTSSDDSFQRNATSDMVVPAAVERWSSLFRG